MFTRRSLLAASAAAGALLPFGLAARASDLPSGTVKFVVSFPAGASTDVIMRAIATKMQASLGNAFIVENRPGAGGLIATDFVAKAKPDGLTLLASPSSLASNPALFKTMPFDTLKDLEPVSLVFRTPLVLLVSSDLPAKSLTDLIAMLKAKPGELNYAHGGPGSAINLAGELLQTMTGTKMNGVSYRGTLPGLNDLIAGRVQLMFADVGGAIGQIEAGQVRPIAVTSTQRVPVLPNVPTMIEAGLEGFEAQGWTLVCTATGTPRATIEKLAAAIDEAVEQPEVKSLIIRIGMLPTKSPPPDQLKPFLASEIDRWGKLIERAGIAKSL
ncbi:tripartite tricarboxylate transporter substrate binding protein [Microbacteriaceae bacterium K1510]|nr:tripartite tricarboxylate transporter substrate binding protein [Microbacteriaceae bacterium K1510]